MTMTLERSFSASAVQIQQVITGLIASAGKGTASGPGWILGERSRAHPLTGAVIDIFILPNPA